MSSVELQRVLRQAMAAGGLSFRDVAEGSGLAVSYVHRLAHGRVAEPSPGALRKLARVPGLSYGALMRAAGYS